LTRYQPSGSIGSTISAVHRFFGLSVASRARGRLCFCASGADRETGQSPVAESDDEDDEEDTVTPAPQPPQLQQVQPQRQQAQQGVSPQQMQQWREQQQKMQQMRQQQEQQQQQQQNVAQTGQPSTSQRQQTAARPAPSVPTQVAAQSPQPGRGQPGTTAQPGAPKWCDCNFQTAMWLMFFTNTNC
jgi:hypothetical protein